jgi:hypothetical protein
LGGDFWQALPSADGGEIVVVGDVSGKGLRAAMVVSLLTGALRNRKSDRPAEILSELNRVAASALRSGFVTALVAHLRDGRAVVANAGHPAPYLDGRELKFEPALPLGIDPEAVYTEREFELGRQITFLSDGVIEPRIPKAICSVSKERQQSPPSRRRRSRKPRAPGDRTTTSPWSRCGRERRCAWFPSCCSLVHWRVHWRPRRKKSSRYRTGACTMATIRRGHAAISTTPGGRPASWFRLL